MRRGVLRGSGGGIRVAAAWNGDVTARDTGILFLGATVSIIVTVGIIHIVVCKAYQTFLVRPGNRC